METAAAFTDQTVQSLIELGRQTAGPKEVQKIEGIPVPFIVNKGVVTALPDLIFNEHAAHPERVKANVSVLDPESFIEYYALFNDPNSRVFADETSLKVLSVLDYHAAGEGNAPRWGQHRVTLNLRQSPEWQTWTRHNNSTMTQQQFAEFLEQNAVDIIQPNPAGIREIAEDLEATVEVDFASVQRQAGGKINLRYTETTKTTVSGGKAVTVPDQFVIAIPAFVGGERVSMQVLLRYRVKEQKLTFFYTLIRPEEVIRTAFLGARQKIADALKVTIINGAPSGQ
jgi:uncharacterized protein YfdQ (DUF2303 family)